MTLTTIILLLIIGILIIMAEIFLVPGTTFVGIIGLILVIVAVVGSFGSLGMSGGWIVSGITLAIIGGLFYLGIKSNTWQRFAVKSSIDGKVEGDAKSHQIGDQGILLTRCAPIGKAEFTNGMIEEVYSLGDYIEAHTKIEIVQIQDQRIIVKPLV
jgi:membrane-bound ClpP family serine protease